MSRRITGGYSKIAALRNAPTSSAIIARQFHLTHGEVFPLGHFLQRGHFLSDRVRHQVERQPRRNWWPQYNTNTTNFV